MDHIRDGYAALPLSRRDIAALRLTDAIISSSEAASPELQAALCEDFSEPQIVELALGVGLFMALSKVMIVLGLEPENMPTTVLPTPGGDE